MVPVSRVPPVVVRQGRRERPYPQIWTRPRTPHHDEPALPWEHGVYLAKPSYTGAVATCSATRISPRSHPCRNASASHGSNCEPAHRSTSPRARSIVNAGR